MLVYTSETDGRTWVRPLEEFTPDRFTSLPEEVSWGDRKDDMSDAIAKSHPHKTKDFATYARAMELVSNRHSKFALVDLVNHLLKQNEKKTDDKTFTKLDSPILNGTIETSPILNGAIEKDEFGLPHVSARSINDIPLDKRSREELIETIRRMQGM